MSLATPISCPKCGFSNQPGYQFCANCGSALTVAAPLTAPAPTPWVAPPPAYPATPAPAYGPLPGLTYGPPPWEYERRKQVDRTKTGLLLLLIGILLSWVPIVLIVGYLLILIGAILVFVGRKPFGAGHSKNAGASIGLIIAGIIGFIVVFVGFFVALVTGVAADPTNPAAVAAAVASALSLFFIGLIVITAVFGLALVLVTYALQAPNGRMLLWAAFGSGLAIQIGVSAFTLAAANTIVSGPITLEAVAALEALQAQATALGLLTVIPSAIFGIAYYLGWVRINRGEIPPPAAPPAPAYAVPPAAPTSPGPAPAAPSSAEPASGSMPPIHPK